MKKFFSDNQVKRFNKCWFWANFGDYDTTRPPEMAKKWSHGAAWRTKIWKKYLTKNISYKKLHLKKFRVNIGQNKKELEFFCQKWPNFGRKRANFEFSTKKKIAHFFTFIKSRLHEKNQKNLMRHIEIW